MADAAFAYRFDAKHPHAKAAADAHAARYVTRVSEETRKAIKAMIGRSIQDGIDPREIAKEIRGVLLSASTGSRMARTVAGLTRPQALAVDNYRRSLQRLMDPNTNLKRYGPKNRGRAQRLRRGGQDLLDQKVQRYADRLMRVRADNIARTEVMGALNAGSLEAGRQAVAKGVLQNPIKKWFVAIDDRLCTICAPMSGEIVPLDEPFSLGILYPPAHPSCRCTFSVREHPLTGRRATAAPTTSPASAAERAVQAFRSLPRTPEGELRSAAFWGRVGANPGAHIPERDLPIPKETVVEPVGNRALIASPHVINEAAVLRLITSLGWLREGLHRQPVLEFYRGKWYIRIGHERLAAAQLLNMALRVRYLAL
jgi:SPP1 gp7 family putative phage head morphogenesis protein